MANSALPIGIFNSNLINVQVFKSSGTYTPTTGTTKVKVRAWGAGGGGGSTNSGGAFGGAGGGGAYVEAFLSNTTSQTITIGAGGAGALANNGSNGVDGTATSFGSLVVAAGGSGTVTGGNPGAAGGTIAACTVPSGGFAMPGGKGADYTVLGTISTGGSAFGNLPTYSINVSQNALAGIANTGQGGGGGNSVNAAGAGGSGLMIIEEYSAATATTGSPAAIQPEMEAATSTTTFVSPGMQQYHPSSAKAWVNFNGTGTIAIRSSYNVTSLTDNGTGDYSINYTTAMSNTNYAAFGDRTLMASTVNNIMQEVFTSRAVGSSRWVTGENNANVDTLNVQVSIFGDL